MSTIKEIDEKIARLEKELAEAKAEKANMWPKICDRFFWLDDDGEIYCSRWGGCHSHHDRLVLGNVFRTEEEADRVIHCLRARKKFLDAGGRIGVRDLPRNIYIVGLTKELDLYVAMRSLPMAFDIWFETPEDCQSAIDSLTEEEVKALCWQGEKR